MDEQPDNVNRRARLSWLDMPVLAALDWEKILYIALILIAVVSRFWDLGARVMSHDESLHTYFSYNLATGKGFAHTPLMHGPFLFHITALSYFLFGDSDFTSRIPTAVFGVLLVALPYLFRRWLGRGGALVASLALLISPSILYHARYIRQEEFILVWTTLTVLCMWRYLVTRQYGWLVGLAAVLAFHAADKSTSFLNVAVFLMFLVPLALLQLYNARRRVSDVLKAAGFGAVLAGVMLVASLIFELVSQLTSSALNLSSIVTQLNPLTLNIDGRTLVYAGVLLLLTALVCVAVSYAFMRFFGAWLRFTTAVAPAFSLFIVFLTTTMFMASPALLLILNPLWQLTTGAELAKISLLGDMANLLNNASMITTMFSLSMALVAVSAAIGIAWNWRRWLPITGVFLAITMTLFTTVFTNAAGIGTGFVGQLGYWMAQQDVKRGSQPPYYYALLVPLYEYMLVIGALCAIFYIAYRAGQLLAAPVASPEEPGNIDDNNTAPGAPLSGAPRDASESEQDVFSSDVTGPSDTPGVSLVEPVAKLEQPAIDKAAWTQSASGKGFMDTPIGRAFVNPTKLFPLFLVWWTFATWIIYSVAGEKMPWLTVHFALPMALLTGWFLDHVLSPRRGTPEFLGRGTPGALRLPSVGAPDALRLPSGPSNPATPPLPLRSIVALGGLSLIIVLLCVRVLSLIGGLDIQPGDTIGMIRLAAGVLATVAGIAFVVYLTRRISKAHLGRALILATFGFLSILTIRTAFMVTYINYDYTKEFLFYAHGAPGTKIALNQIDELSKSIYGDMSLKVGYDSDVSWPMSWYMREFPNARFNGDGLPDNYSDQEVIMIGDSNPKRTENETKLQDNYTKFNYMLVWWPMQDYFDLTWDRISYSLTNPQARAALWDIILNRDFTRYSQVFNKTSLTPDKWSPGHRFTVFIRNDVATKVWSYRVGAVASGSNAAVNPAIKLQGSTNLAFASNGERFIIDHKANRVVKTDPKGNPISTFGGFGNSDGKFNDPWGIAVDTDGSIFVADTFNHRIQKFDASGNFLFSWGTPGVSADPGSERSTVFFGPRAIIFDNNGHLLVSDTGNKRIQVFDREGNYVAQFGQTGTGNGEFNEPVGLAVDATGNVYVADIWNQRIQVFDPQYKFLRAWVIPAWQSMDQGELQSVDQKPFLAVDGNTLLISSPMTRQVLAYSLDGKPVDLPGVTFPADSLPTGLTVHDNRLYVTNAENGAISDFALVGK